MRYFLTITARCMAMTVPPPAIAWWCDNYGSQFEANQACEAWTEEGPKYTIKLADIRRNLGAKPNKYHEPPRYKDVAKTACFCRHDNSTSQFLGEQNICVKNGETFKPFGTTEYCYKIKSRFKY